MPAYINAIATAVPPHDVHDVYLRFAERRLPAREANLFRRMAERAGIAHRYSVLAPAETGDALDREGLFAPGGFAGTARRMAVFAREAPVLAEAAVAGLDAGAQRSGVTHLVLATCTGFVAPGVDQILCERLGLGPDVERTVVGFMGCAAAVNALRVAHHIVRSEPDASVLVVNVELCTLHLQDTTDLEATLMAMLFGDGASAAIVSARPEGLLLRDFRSVTIPGSEDLITWRIGNAGFDMGLSGEVPARIESALRHEPARAGQGLLRGDVPGDVSLWAVHAGGRTILDAVQHGLALPGDALGRSRGVLRDYGNMSSPTLMFVLERMLREGGESAPGFAMAFGPGLVAETFRFERLAAAGRMQAAA